MIRALASIVLVGLMLGAPAFASADVLKAPFHQRFDRTRSVPELDPGAASAAVTLLFGAAVLLAERRRRPKQ